MQSELHGGVKTRGRQPALGEYVGVRACYTNPTYDRISLLYGDRQEETQPS